MWLKCKLVCTHYIPKTLEKEMMFIRDVYYGNYSYKELYILNRIPNTLIDEYFEEHGFPITLSIVYEGNGNDEIPVVLANSSHIGWWDEGEDSDEYYDVTIKEFNTILQNYEGEVNILMEDTSEGLFTDFFEGKCILSLPEQEFIINDEKFIQNEEFIEKVYEEEERW